MAIWTPVAKEGWRTRIALAICALSAVWGVIVVAVGTDHAPRDVAWVAAVWGGVGIWLDDFRGLRKTPAQIYQDARLGKLYRSPLHKMIRSGSLLLFILAIVCLFR